MTIDIWTNYSYKKRWIVQLGLMIFISFLSMNKSKKICFPALVPSQTQFLFCFWNLLFSKVYIIHKVNLIWSYVLVTKTEATDSQREFYIATWLSCKYINSTLHIWFIVIRIKCPTQIHGYICVCDLSNRHKLACSCFILTIWTHLCPSFECEKKNKLCHELKSTRIRKLIKLMIDLKLGKDGSNLKSL